MGQNIELVVISDSVSVTSAGRGHFVAAHSRDTSCQLIAESSRLKGEISKRIGQSAESIAHSAWDNVLSFMHEQCLQTFFDGLLAHANCGFDFPKVF